MDDLVIYHPRYNMIKLYRLNVPYYQKGQWPGEPFSAWKSLEIAIDYGWIVIGEL